MIEALQGLMDTPAIYDNTLKNYAGTYEDRVITYENGNLFYQRKGRPKMQMTAMGTDTFMFKDIDYFRIKFVKDSNGNITRLNGLYDDGHTNSAQRTN